MANVLSFEAACAVLVYEPFTGRLFWRDGRREAGTTDADGYRAVQVNGVVHRVHRIAWLLTHGVWPSGEIDHLDGDPGNNRIQNLRDVSRSVNAQNQRRPAAHNESSSSIGVSWQPSRKRWMASISVAGKTKYIGRFGTEEEAAKAYWEAKATYHPSAPLRNRQDSDIVPT